MSPKIALFVASLTGGGAERVMVVLANCFAHRNIQTHLVIAKPILTYASELDSRVRLVNLNTYRMTRTLVSLARYLKRERPEAILSTLVEANITAVAARWLSGTSTRLFIREASTPSRALRRHHRLQKRITARLLPLAYRYADGVIAISEGVYNDLTRRFHLPPHKVHLIHNPVPLKKIRTLMLEPIAHPWFEDASAPVILSVGNLRRAKDYPTLLRAFARVREHLPAHLLIIGEGEERPRLERTIELLNLREVVQMPGFDPNPFRYMHRAKLFVLSSIYEGFPNVLVQALVCGCPVVSTDCESGPRDILKGGAYGRLTPPGDSDALADAIVESFAHPCASPPQEWLEQFDEDHVAEQYLKLLLSA